MSTYGFVYILLNPCMPGILKIGCTNRSPHERARELSSPTGVPDDFFVLAYFEMQDFRAMEARVHHELGEHRVNPSREFFMLSGPELQSLMRDLWNVADGHYCNPATMRIHFMACERIGMEGEPMGVAANA